VLGEEKDAGLAGRWVFVAGPEKFGDAPALPLFFTTRLPRLLPAAIAWRLPRAELLPLGAP